MYHSIRVTFKGSWIGEMDVNIIAVGDCSVRRFRRGERLSVSWSMLLLVGVSMWCPCIEGLFVRIYVGICAGDVQSVSRDSEFGAGVPRSDSPRYERVADETCPGVVNFLRVILKKIEIVIKLI